MRRSVIGFFLIAVLLYGCTLAIAETLIDVDVVMNCDGIPMQVSGAFLTNNPEVQWCEYKSKKLSKNETRTLYQSIDWKSLDCDMAHAVLMENAPGTTSSCFADGRVLEGGFGVVPFCEVYVQNKGDIAESPYRYILSPRTTAFDTRPMGLVSWDDAINRAMNIASKLDMTIGNPVAMKRCDDFLAVGRASGEPIDQYRTQWFPTATDEELNDIKTLEIIYPVYWQGKRLYSGETQSQSGESFVLSCPFRLALHHTGRIISLHAPTFGQWKSFGKSGAAMPLTDALEKLRAIYADMYMPGVSTIKVTSGDMCYVPIAGDARASKGFHIYPCYVFSVEMIFDDGTCFDNDVGIHVLTGRQVF